jgi:integrase
METNGQSTDEPIDRSQEVTFEIVPAAPVPPPPRLRHALTLANLWQAWVGMKELRPNTIKRYDSVGRMFCKFFESEDCGGLGHKLSPIGMTEWMHMLRTRILDFRVKRPLSAASINKINHILKPFLRWMKKMHYVNSDLADCIPTLLTGPPKETLIITEADYETLKAYCSGRAWCQTHLWLFILGYRTGMSLIDCCHLRWRDVHLNDNEPSYIDIHRIKMATRMGDRAKCQIPIVPFSDLHLWLLNLRHVTPWKRADGITDYVHQEGPGLYACVFQKFRQDMKNIMLRAGLDPKKTFKCFRNSLCSNLVNSGMSLPNVCRITGHNSVQVLMGYLKPDRRVLQDGMARSQQYSASTLEDGKYATGFQPDDAAFL